MEKNMNVKPGNNSSPCSLTRCVGEVSHTEVPSGICRTSELKLKAKIVIKNTKYF